MHGMKLIYHLLLLVYGVYCLLLLVYGMYHLLLLVVCVYNNCTLYCVQCTLYIGYSVTGVGLCVFLVVFLLMVIRYPHVIYYFTDLTDVTGSRWLCFTVH